MSRPRLNLSGKRYGALQVQSYAGKDVSQNTRWECICDCGKTKIARGSELKRGNTTSCGCLGRKRQIIAVTKHGQSRNPLNAVWRQMIARTCNPKTASFQFYGARGISVCSDWVKDFEHFCSWAETSGYRPGLSIDRINNDAGYSPGNCRWVTAKDQAANRRVRKDSVSRKEREMKTFKIICAQGEITTDVIDRLPADAVLRKVEPINGRLVISHSEQGHDHYIPVSDAELFERTDSVPAGMQIFYSIVKNPTALKQAAAVPHDEILLEARIYRHRISREYDPFLDQARRVAD